MLLHEGYTETPDSTGLISPSISAVKVWKAGTKLCVAFKGSKTAMEWISNANIGENDKILPKLQENDLFRVEVEQLNESKIEDETQNDSNNSIQNDDEDDIGQSESKDNNEAQDETQNENAHQEDARIGNESNDDESKNNDDESKQDDDESKDDDDESKIADNGDEEDNEGANNNNNGENSENTTTTCAKVHQGFLDGYLVLRDKIIHAIKENLNENNQVINDFKEIWFCGHSRGGSIASIAAVDLANIFNLEKGQVKSLTIGSPAVGDELFRKLYEEKVGSENTYRMINYFDPVPRLFDVVNPVARAVAKNVAVHVCKPYILDFGFWHAYANLAIDVHSVPDKIKKLVENAYKHHFRANYFKNMYEYRSKWDFWVQNIKKLDFKTIKNCALSFVRCGTDKNGKTVVSYVKHTVSTVAGTSSKSASTTVTNAIVNATPLGWINLAVNVVGHAATNLHIHKMWKDQTKRFDALETIMTDVRKAVENAEERMINTVKSEIDGLKVEMNTVVKSLSDVVKGEFDNHRIEALSASTKQLSVI